MNLRTKINQLTKRIDEFAAFANRKICGVLRFSEYDALVSQGRVDEIGSVLLVPDPVTKEEWVEFVESRRNESTAVEIAKKREDFLKKIAESAKQ